MDEKTIIKELLKSIEKPIIFEIGGHVGQDSIWFKKTIKDCILHVFEPDPRNILQIRNKMNGFGDTVINECAVGSVNDIVDFHLSSGIPKDWLAKGYVDNSYVHTASSTIKKPTEHVNKVYDWMRFDSIVKVKCVTLDTYAIENSIDHIDFIWADVEGAEYEMLIGAKNILQKTRYLYTEYSEHSDTPVVEGIIDANDIIGMLGPKWQVIKNFNSVSRHDILLKNNSYV